MESRTLGRILLVCLCCLAWPADILLLAAEPEPKVFRAGAASSNITPPLGEPIVGGFSPVPARTVHDELHARCLVLDDGDTRLALVVCDNVGIPREVFDAARARIVERTGIPAAHQLFSSTHTHSATSARAGHKLEVSTTLNAYQQFVVRRIADGVERAIYELQPARLAWGKAQAPEHVFNRRWFMQPQAQLRDPFGGFDRVMMNPRRADPNLKEPAGPVDPEITFLSIQTADGKPLALWANYSLHYVGGVPAHEISADYFALFAERLADRWQTRGQRPAFVGMLTNGTSGDVNNINFREPGEKLAPYVKMQQVADSVADKVIAAHQNLEFHTTAPLAARMQELQLSTRKPTPEQIAFARQVLAKPPGAEKEHVREIDYARRTIDQSTAPDQIQAPLQVLRIGDLGIAAIPFEVFTEIGLEIKAKGPLPQTCTVSLANGSYGYLPTPEQHALGGYETWLGTNVVETEASRKITRTLLEMLESLRGKSLGASK